jgi:hypothetical protein
MAAARAFRTSGPQPLLRFSFRYLDTTHPAFDVRKCGAEYYRLLLARLHELSAVSVTEFRSRAFRSLRIHRIDFEDPRLSIRSFGIRGELDADTRAWQFALSANEHGRVHGFLMGEVFYVRWLDPEHNLYSGN